MISFRKPYKKDFLYSTDFSDARRINNTSKLHGVKEINKFFHDLTKKPGRTSFRFIARIRENNFSSFDQEIFILEIKRYKKSWFGRLKTYALEIEMTPETFQSFIKIYCEQIVNIMDNPVFHDQIKKVNLSIYPTNEIYQLDFIPLEKNTSLWVEKLK